MQWPLDGRRSEFLTHEEYEEIYRETLFCLAENHAVGTASRPDAVSGGRRCLIDGVNHEDHEVLTLWWGAEISNEILKQYAAWKREQTE